MPYPIILLKCSLLTDTIGTSFTVVKKADVSGKSIIAVWRCDYFRGDGSSVQLDFHRKKENRKKWYYTENARKILIEYVRKFPRIVDAISKSSRGPYLDFDGDDELKKRHEWVLGFRSVNYKRIDVKTGEDFTGIK